MSRTLSTENRDAILGDVVRPAWFAEFHFVGGTVRLWTGKGQMTWDDKIFTGLGTMGPISGISETVLLEARVVNFSLSGVPSELTAEILAEVNRMRPVYVWQGFLNETRTAVVDTPILRFAGRMDQMQIEESGDTSRITIPAEDLLAQLTRPRIIRLSHEEQQRRFPGDLGFEHLIATATTTIYFGPNPAPSAGSDGGRGPGVIPPWKDPLG